MSKKVPPPLPAQEAEQVSRPSKATPHEKDAGFNESHGYGPSHGGPSGPGDAPSKSPATVVPNDADANDPGDNDEMAD